MELLNRGDFLQADGGPLMLYDLGFQISQGSLSLGTKVQEMLALQGPE